MIKIIKKSILAFILLVVFTVSANSAVAAGESRAAATSSASSSSSPSAGSSRSSSSGSSSSFSPISASAISAPTLQMAVNQNNQNNNAAQVNSLPVIASAISANVTSTSATVSGKVNPGGLNTIVWFETPTGGPYQVQNLGNGNATVILTSYNFTGLTPATTYTFRVVASNSLGNTFGNWISFTTLTTNGGGNGNGNGQIPYTAAPVIVSSAYSAVGTTSVTLSGSVNPRHLTTDAWFEIQGGSSSLAHQVVGTGNVATPVNSYNLTGLTPHTTYSFRLNAQNSLGITYGTWTSFTTNSSGGGGGGGGGYIYATVATQNANNISINTATLNGIVYHGNSYTTTWFQYGTSSNLASFSETSHTSTGSVSSLQLAKSIAGLSANTTYYFRIVANSNNNTQTGNIFSFKTDPIVIINNNQNNNNDIIIDNGNTVKETTTTDSTPKVVEQNNVTTSMPQNTNDLSANVLFGYGSFLPSSLFQWVLFLILLLAIMIIGRRIYLNIQKEKDLEVNADHIENLPTE